MKNRKRILVVGELFTPSHLMRPWAIAQHLATDERYEVHFAAPRAVWPTYTGTAHIEMHDLRSLDRSIFRQRMKTLTPYYSAKELITYVTDEQKLLTDVQPNVVMSDFRHSLALSARLCHVPYVPLLDFYWSPRYDVPAVVPDSIFTSLVGERISRFFAPGATKLYWYLTLRAFNIAARHFGLPTYRSILDVYTDGSAVIYFDIPSVPDFTNIPKHHYFVGPCLWEMPASAPSWLTSLPDDSACFICVGSTGAKVSLSRVSDALLPLGMPQIIATADHTVTFSSPQVFAAPYLPLSIVLKKSACVVCHGGTSMVYQALTYGLPFIGMPSNAAHWYGSLQFEKRGYGITLSPETATPEVIRAAVHTLLTDTAYAERCRVAQEELRHYDWRTRIPDVLDTLTHG